MPRASQTNQGQQRPPVEENAFADLLGENSVFPVIIVAVLTLCMFFNIHLNIMYLHSAFT